MAKKEIVEEKLETEVPVEAPKKTRKAKKVVEEKTTEAAPEVKKGRKGKKEVAEAPAKPKRLEAKAISKNVRVTPRKVRLVMNMVRGKDVVEAMNILNHTNKMAVVPVLKLIRSAYANATNNFNLDGDKLYIYEIYATDGMRMKRFLPRAKGSASSLTKRFSHLYVTLRERGE